MSTTETVRGLFALACPKCGSDSQLHLVITTWATLSADGSESLGDHEWDDTANCRCIGCKFAGVASDFAVFDSEEVQP
jgi:hypothetical protein